MPPASAFLVNEETMGGDSGTPDPARSTGAQDVLASAPAPQPGTEVYAIHGAEPEVLAYAMAKYSRSALSMRESLREISAQRAEQFLNTFYFQYGHRSIADLAHVPFAIERLSLLAAIEVVDEQRWDGQERSTRYQNFRRSGWTTPVGLAGESRVRYTAVVEALFAAYERVGARMAEALGERLPRPAEMAEDAYRRTLKARAFDVARYLLPLATNTSLGQIVNARTLETQVSRLLSSRFAEVREIGAKLRAAAAGPAWNVGRELAERRLAETGMAAADRDAVLAASFPEVKVAPTLVKYAAASAYAEESRRQLTEAATELMRGREIEAAPAVDLVEGDEPLEVELATSLLYPHCHFSYRQLRKEVAAVGEARRLEVIGLGTASRGRHDELLRSFSAGAGLRFDILMDVGGFRDMHRHRRCTQLLQGYTDAHGYEEPVCPGQPTLAEAGLEVEFRAAMDAALASFRSFAQGGMADAAPYLLPLGVRCRSMFKMDFAEAVYIAELRSGPAGHFSYRRVAWAMVEAMRRQHPGLEAMMRVADVNEPVDLLRR